VLKHVQKVELARLSIHLFRLEISRGQRLISNNAPAEQTFLIEKGAIEIRDVNGRSNRTANGYVGIAAAIGLPRHEEDAIALEDTTVIVFPQQYLQHLLPIMESVGLTDAIAHRLVGLGRFADHHLPAFIGVLCLLIVGSRLIFPTGVTVVLFTTAIKTMDMMTKTMSPESLRGTPSKRSRVY
jgi:hypothetical protein